MIAQIQTTFGLVQLKLGANNQVIFDPGDMFDSLRLGQSTTFQGVYRVADVAGTLPRRTSPLGSMASTTDRAFRF